MADDPETKAQLENVTELLKSTANIIRAQDARLKDPKRPIEPKEMLESFREVVLSLSQVVKVLAMIMLKESRT
jgi:hypothetical protein